MSEILAKLERTLAQPNGCLPLIRFRFCTICLLPVFLLALLLPASGQDAAVTLKSFHDEVANATYFYPASLIAASLPEPASIGTASPCSRVILSAASSSSLGDSTFTVSTIDNSCPDLRGKAVTLGTYVREQLLLAVKRYGEPVSTDNATSYAIAERPAALLLATIPTSARSGKPAGVLYAVEGCALSTVPLKPHKNSKQAVPVDRVLCFLFTTQNKGLLNELYSFLVVFDNGPPQSIFAPSAIRSIAASALH